jgi:hypothetical protein
LKKEGAGIVMRGLSVYALSSVMALAASPAAGQDRENAAPGTETTINPPETIILHPEAEDFDLSRQPLSTSVPLLHSETLRNDPRNDQRLPDMKEFETVEPQNPLRQEFDDGRGSIRLKGKGAKIEWRFSPNGR